MPQDELDTFDIQRANDVVARVDFVGCEARPDWQRLASKDRSGSASRSGGRLGLRARRADAGWFLVVSLDQTGQLSRYKHARVTEGEVLTVPLPA